MNLVYELLAAAVDDESKSNSLKDALETFAIPVTIIGAILSAAYSYVLIKNSRDGVVKTRLESEKIRLETEKLRVELHGLGVDRTSDDHAARTPEPEPAGTALLRSPTVESIILRFIALELFARLWFAVASPATNALSRFNVFESILDLGSLASLAFWIFAAPLAFSIFADLNSVLGIRFRDLSMWRSQPGTAHTRRARRFLITILLVLVLPAALLIVLFIVLGDA